MFLYPLLPSDTHHSVKRFPGSKERGDASAWQRAATRNFGLVEPIFPNRVLVENHEQMRKNTGGP